MRRSSNATFKSTIILGTTMSLSTCSGTSEGIYDDSIEAGMEIKESNFSQVSAIEYTSWTYIDLSECKATTVEIGEEHKSGIPTRWDFAIRRYDIKTNEDAVLQTTYISIGDLKVSGEPSAKENSIKDERTTDKIVIDMSGMMGGNIKHTEDYRDDILSSQLNVDTSSMPPVYTMFNQVYLIQLKDNVYAAIRFINYTNARSIEGCTGFDLLYPLDFEGDN